MCDPAWPKIWKSYPFHRKANRASWLSGEVHRRTVGKAKSQYNPLLYHTDAQIAAIELECINSGTLISDHGNRRTYFLKTATITGVDAGVDIGKETYYLFAEWHENGDVHGRPISEDSLRRLGANP